MGKVSSYDNLLDLRNRILQLDEEETAYILSTVLRRHRQLHPNQDVSVLYIDKCRDRSEQLDKIIRMLENMKTSLI